MANPVLSVLAVVSNQLSNFLLEEAKMLGGLGQEVLLISDEFGHMKAFLQKMAEEPNQQDDPQIKEWIRQVREAAYDTEDVIDEFMLLFACHRPPGISTTVLWNFNSIKNLPARHRLAAKLQNIKARIKNISEARLRYESRYGYAQVLPLHLPLVTAAAAANNPWNWRHSKDDDALLADEAQLVGIEKPRKHLISQLLEGESESQPIKVIAVLGMGGIGKTTLVKQVHDHADVKSYFQIRVWATVSQTCDVLGLLKGLVRQLRAPVPPMEMEGMDTYELKALVRDCLQQGRYAIVFDDVWGADFWEAFRFVLPENSYGGNRVMITTRIADVASACCVKVDDSVYRMECLSPQDSWILFCRNAFKGGHSCPPHLKNVAEGILGKCEGLPLAIVAISGLLASKDLSRLDEWEQLRRRLGDEFEGSGKLERVRQILFLSYNDLPSTLKTCLLYTSIYPEDDEIRCYHLIRLLNAEGFVERKVGFTADDVAWDYLKQLANRNLIQMSEVLDGGLPGSFHIHDLLREIIVSESREQNMLMLVDNKKHGQTDWILEKKVARRVAFHNSFLEKKNISHHHFNNLRSIITFGQTEPPSKALLTVLLSSKFLKVVNLRGMQLEEIPKHIFNLFHLTYLHLTGTGVKKVPKSIRRLRNLEYLDLRGTNVRKLPQEIQELHKLHHILVYQEIDPSDGDSGTFGFKVPCNMGKLLALQTLSEIDAAESGKTGILSEIGKLSQLRAVALTNVRREDGKELCSSIEKLKNLRELVLSSSIQNDGAVLDLNHPISASSLQLLCWLYLRGRLEKMPPWIRDLQSLGEIRLSWSSLTDDPLEHLQDLPNLAQISLNQTYDGEVLCFKAGGFRKLKTLYLKNMNALRLVRIEEGAMPCVNHLAMQQLPLLEELPLGIEHLRQLQRLEILSLSSQLTKDLENEAFEECEDYRKIAHVPQIVIGFQRDGRWINRQLSRRKKSNT